MIDPVYTSWLLQLKENGTLELEARQFLALVVHYHDFSPNRFSTQLLGKEQNYIYSCKTPRRGYAREKGLDPQMAATVSNLFDDMPYADPNFWQQSPITLKSSEPLPLVNTSKIPSGVNLGRDHWNLRKSANSHSQEDAPNEITPTPIGSVEMLLGEKAKTQKEKPTLSVEEAMDSLNFDAPPPQKEKKPLSVEEELDNLTFRRVTSKIPPPPSVEDALDNAVFEVEPLVKPQAPSPIGSVEAALDGPPAGTAIPSKQTGNHVYQGTTTDPSITKTR